MTKRLTVMAVVILVGAAIALYRDREPYGFYHGLDVPSGVATFTRGLLGNGLVESGS